MNVRSALPLVAAPVLLAAAFAAPLYAQSTATPAPAAAPPANVQACKACHGPFGISVNPSFPNLAGQKPVYLENQLKAFRGKTRTNPFMNAIAAQLSDQDIHELAHYWSSLPATPAEGHGAPTAPAIPSRMTLPPDFPKGFRVYQTVSEDGAITKRYANDIAWNAAKAGQPLPSGSVLIQASYKAEKDASGKEVAGAVQALSAMESRTGWGDAIPTLLRNGDWDYAVFSADGKRRDQLNQAPCLACHKPQVASSYVFTLGLLHDAAVK